MRSAERLHEIRQNIKKWQDKSPLAAKEITLVAVSKTHPVEAIIALIEVGQKVFGENQVQEAAAKWPAIRKLYPDVELHLIGSLQTNKVREALALFDVIHTVDRESLADAIIKKNKTSGVRCKRFLVQVNTGEEPQKGGVMPRNFPSLLEYVRHHGFPVEGLMCVPPADALPAPHFALLRTMAEGAKTPYLSMGMSNDYETAIRFGATHIRIGTALFGERKV